MRAILVPVPAAAAAEHAIVERIAEGDEQAFEQLFSSYYTSLCEFTHSYLGSKETAEELVQSALFKIWERRRTWDPRAGVRAYLFAACRNGALDWLAHEQTVDRARDEALSTGEVPALGQPPMAPDVAAEAAELGDALRAAVAELPERQRAVVILRWQHQMGPSEIAVVLGITVKGVEASFSRSIVHLRDRLAPFR